MNVVVVVIIIIDADIVCVRSCFHWPLASKRLAK